MRDSPRRCCSRLCLLIMVGIGEAACRIGLYGRMPVSLVGRLPIVAQKESEVRGIADTQAAGGLHLDRNHASRISRRPPRPCAITRRQDG